MTSYEMPCDDEEVTKYLAKAQAKMEKWWEAQVQALEAEKASERPRKTSYEMPCDDEDCGKELNAEVNEDNEVNEDREVDYMSDESSDSEEEEEEKADAKGVDQDEGLSKMLDSDESSDEDKDKDKDKDDEDDEDETGKKKKKSSSRANSDDEEEGKGKKKGSTNNSRSGTPTKDVEKVDKAEKRKAMVANLLDPNAEAPAKKSRLEQFGNAAPGAMQGNEAISEEAVRRYLKRRPMTTTDLLKKFRSKKTGIQNAQLVQLLANILKKINPHKHKVKGVTYLSLKEEK